MKETLKVAPVVIAVEAGIQFINVSQCKRFQYEGHEGNTKELQK
jgi:hypothetical protein